MSDPIRLLSELVGAMATGAVRVVDLTQTLSPAFPQIALPPEMGQCWPFRIEEASRYDARGPGWYWNNFSCGEHTGTHFDAPIHWITGRDLPNNSVDTIPAQHFVAPACVVDCSAAAAADPDYLMTVADLEAFEAAHGRIPEGAWLLMRTDWSQRRDPEAYQNFDETGQHTPGPSAEAVRFLVEERGVLGFGSEAIGTDAGQGAHLRPPYPCHTFMHGAGRYGLQCLTNLHLLPPTGAVLICPPLKIEKGSGSPLRVLALVGGRRMTVVVTGGSAGIGRAICEDFLARGHEVVSLDRDPAAFDAPNLHTLRVDLTDRAATAEAADALARRFEVTTLVHNAGAIRPALLHDVRLADVDALVELHLASAIRLVQAALPAMRARRFGRVVLVSSRAALGLAMRTAYSATKAGLVGMARTWALELAADGITVNVVAPGPVRTAMFHEVVEAGSERERALAAAVPVKRLGEPADVARAVAFFADPANGYVTGQLLCVCGGTSVGSLSL